MDDRRAEAAAERDMLLDGQRLVAKEDREIGHQRVVDFLELLVAERLRQIHAGDLGADRRGQFPHLDRVIRHAGFLRF